MQEKFHRQSVNNMSFPTKDNLYDLKLARVQALSVV